MPVPNIFNVPGVVSGNQVILTGVPGHSWRVRQLNVQNREASTEVNIEIKTGTDTVIGPILLQAKQLLSIELASEEDQSILILEEGDDLTISTDTPALLTVFGFAGIA